MRHGRNLTNESMPVIELHSKLAVPEFAYPNPDASLASIANLKNLQDWKEHLSRYWLSNEGKTKRRGEHCFKTSMEPDGSFRFEHIPAGEYSLTIRSAMGFVASNDKPHEVSIPSSADGTPIELGVLQFTPPAPD